MKAMKDIGMAAKAENLAALRKGLMEMKTALDNAVASCGLTGACAGSVKAASNAVANVDKELENLNDKAAIMRAFKALKAALDNMGSSCGMRLMSGAFYTPEFFS